MTSLQKLNELSREITSLSNISALLQWDQEVYMPPGAVAERSMQLALITRLIHQRSTATELGDLLKKVEEELHTNNKVREVDHALFRVMKRSYDQSVKLPEEFVVRFSELTSQALAAWIDARKNKSFVSFSPFLEKIVAMSREQAEYLGYESSPYNALLDLYEEGLTSDRVSAVFVELRTELVPLLEEIVAKKRWKTELKFQPSMDISRQVAFSKEILRYIGYDFDRGREDVSTHPFTISLGHNDRRVTNRYAGDDMSFIFSALHEGGHGLYELGIADELNGIALDTGVSLGIHETQSRLWENLVGRSKEFWEGYYGKLQETFAEQLKDVTLDEFYVFINQVKPGFIRVDADEVTYNLHILIRFEIERDLIEQKLEVKDVREVWNSKYKEYLGLDVVDDALGVLQDIHWSHGSIGYFPTYTLGNMGAAQFWASYKKFDPEYRDTLRMGDMKKIHAWLREHIYQHGSVYTPTELMKRVTGEELSAKYLIDYLKEKYV